VKWAVLRRYGFAEGAWIESGTYYGRTTAYLAKRASRVWTIEPSESLAGLAAKKLARFSNVELVRGLSENVLSGLLQEVESRGEVELSLWLDGHFSEGGTFLGPSETPIIAELAAVEERLPNIPRWAIFVDDFRCFEPENPKYSTYPTRSFLVAFSERNGLNWTVEHDIFVCWKR
jgi:hypothetical protein